MLPPVTTTTDRMATADVAWLHMDRPDNLMVVNCVFWFDAALDAGAVTQALADRLVPAFPHFGQRVSEPAVTVGLVGPRWEDIPGFRAADHVVSARLPAPGGDEELHAYVSEQASVPLDRNRPLWQVHVIAGYGSGSAVLLRTHHALADGTALVQALLTLVDAPEADDLHAGQRPLVPAKERPASPGEALLAQGGRLARNLLGGWASALNPGRALQNTLALPSNWAMLNRLGFSQSDEPTSLRRPLSGQKLFTWARSVPLEDVRAASKRSGATVNDLALTAIAGALRRHLEEQGQDVSRLTAVVPVNLRAADAPLDPEQGNEFGLAFVRLPVGEADRAARLTAVRAAMDRVKATSEAVVVYGALSLMGQSPAQLEQAWIALFTGRASAVVTNIAGPREPVSLAGVPLAGFVAWVPCTGPIGIGFSVCSYAGKLVLGVNVDRALVSDSEHLLSVLGDELEQVVATAGAS
jgi:diacylglycerol O-acyltransferase